MVRVLSHIAWIALTDVGRRAKFSIPSSPFTGVSCLFLVQRMRSLSCEVRSIPRKVVGMTKTCNGLHRVKVSAGCTAVVCWACTLFGTRRSSSCTCKFASVDFWWTLILDRTTTRHATGEPEVCQTQTACSENDYWQGTHVNGLIADM